MPDTLHPSIVRLHPQDEQYVLLIRYGATLAQVNHPRAFFIGVPDKTHKVSLHSGSLSIPTRLTCKDIGPLFNARCVYTHSNRSFPTISSVHPQSLLLRTLIIPFAPLMTAVTTYLPISKARIRSSLSFNLLFISNYFWWWWLLLSVAMVLHLSISLSFFSNNLSYWCRLKNGIDYDRRDFSSRIWLQIVGTWSRCLC